MSDLSRLPDISTLSYQTFSFDGDNPEIKHKESRFLLGTTTNESFNIKDRMTTLVMRDDTAVSGFRQIQGWRAPNGAVYSYSKKENGGCEITVYGSDKTLGGMSFRPKNGAVSEAKLGGNVYTPIDQPKKFTGDKKIEIPSAPAWWRELGYKRQYKKQVKALMQSVGLEDIQKADLVAKKDNPLVQHGLEAQRRQDDRNPSQDRNRSQSI